MGIIMRNGIPYGGTDNDFTIADSLDSIENPKKEHLYSVDQKLYYWDEEWKPCGGGEVPEIEADEGDIIIGNGSNWANKSQFKVVSCSIPSPQYMPPFNGKYSEGYINQIGLNYNQSEKNFICLSGGNIDGATDFIQPFLAMQGKAQMFLRGGSSIDIGDDLYNSTQIDNDKGPIIRIHGTPLIEIDNGYAGGEGPWIRMHHNANVSLEDNAFFKMDDKSTMVLENCASFIMQGVAGGGNHSVNIEGPSPVLNLNGASGIFMDHRGETACGPAIIMTPSNLIFRGEGATGQGTPNHSRDGSGIELMGNMTPDWPSFDLSPGRIDEPVLRIGKGAQINIDGGEDSSGSRAGSVKINIGTYGGIVRYDLTSLMGYTFLKMGVKQQGRATYIFEGNDSFIKFDGFAHNEQEEGSYFVMRNQLKSTINSSRREFDTIINEDTTYYSDIESFIDNNEQLIILQGNINGVDFDRENSTVRQLSYTYAKGSASLKMNVNLSIDKKSIKKYNQSDNITTENILSPYSYINWRDKKTTFRQVLIDTFGWNILNKIQSLDVQDLGAYIEVSIEIQNYEYNYVFTSPEKILLDLITGNNRTVDIPSNITLSSLSQKTDIEKAIKNKIANFHNIESKDTLIINLVSYFQSADVAYKIIANCSVPISTHREIDLSSIIDYDNRPSSTKYNPIGTNLELQSSLGPIHQMYNESIFLMRGTNLLDQHEAKRIPNNSLLEIRDMADVSFGGLTKIRTRMDENKGWVLQIGVHGADETDNPDDLVEFTLADLKALKQLLN